MAAMYNLRKKRMAKIIKIFTRFARFSQTHIHIHPYAALIPLQTLKRTRITCVIYYVPHHQYTDRDVECDEKNGKINDAQNKKGARLHLKSHTFLNVAIFLISRQTLI